MVCNCFGNYYQCCAYDDYCKGNDEKLIVLVTTPSLIEQLPALIEEKTHLFQQNIEVQLVDAILRNESGKVINQ